MVAETITIHCINILQVYWMYKDVSFVWPTLRIPLPAPTVEI